MRSLYGELGYIYTVKIYCGANKGERISIWNMTHILWQYDYYEQNI